MTELKIALRKLAKAVVVVTSRREGQRMAMSATAVSEISLDPPTMLVCVNQNSAIHPALSAPDAVFCLNILHKSQDDIARACGGGAKGEERFASGDWRETKDGVPRLADAAIICRAIQSVSIGTHDIIIGQVEETFLSETADPLIYVDGRYACAG